MFAAFLVIIDSCFCIRIALSMYASNLLLDDNNLCFQVAHGARAADVSVLPL
jgi:hypothetical protein